MDNYKTFLLALVDRYDGKGNNDMQRLTKPIIYWEIMNEPEFKMFFKGKKDEFIEIFNFSSKIIKEKQKDSIIVMAGAAGMFPENKKFWKSVLPKIKDNFELGWNLDTSNKVNMLSEGIIDPTKVTRCALENAASVANTLLTTECVIVDKPEDTPTTTVDQPMF